jgi:hypothetical protein
MQYRRDLSTGGTAFGIKEIAVSINFSVCDLLAPKNNPHMS